MVDGFDTSDDSASICLIFEDTHPYSLVADHLSDKFKPYSTSIMATVRQRIIFVGGPYTTFDKTSSWATDTLEGVLKREYSSTDCDGMLGGLGYLGGFYVGF